MFSSKQGPLGQVWSSHSIICRREFARSGQLVITGLGRASARYVVIMPPPPHTPTKWDMGDILFLCCPPIRQVIGILMGTGPILNLKNDDDY